MLYERDVNDGRIQRGRSVTFSQFLFHKERDKLAMRKCTKHLYWLSEGPHTSLAVAATSLGNSGCFSSHFIVLYFLSTHRLAWKRCLSHTKTYIGWSKVRLILSKNSDPLLILIISALFSTVSLPVMNLARLLSSTQLRLHHLSITLRFVFVKTALKIPLIAGAASKLAIIQTVRRNQLPLPLRSNVCSKILFFTCRSPTHVH